MNNFWLVWVPSLAAAMASLVGVGVAITQLGSVSRWRQTATFWKDQLVVTNPTYDQDVARSLYREAASRVVALQAYPGWKISGWLLAVLGSAAYSVITGYGVASNILGKGSGLDLWVNLGSILFISIATSWGFQEISFMLDRRRIVTFLFLRNQVLSSKMVDEVMSIRTTFRKRLFPEYTGHLFLSGGLSLFAVSIGGAAKSAKEGIPNITQFLLWADALPVLGCMLFWVGYQLSRFSLTTEWLHPDLRDSSDQPETTVDTSSAEHSESPNI